MPRNALIVLVVSAASALAAAPPAADKADKPAAADSLKVTVTSVSGPAQKLLAGKGEKNWQALKVGETLSELTVIRTGLGAKVVLKFEDRGEVIINNATKIGIAELRKKGAAAKARLGLKYGTLRASVDSKKGSNDFRIATPVATLSVRGSSADVGYSVDSTKIVAVRAGLWNVVKSIKLPDFLKGMLVDRIIQAGETADSTLDLYITDALQDRIAAVYDTYGTTPAEVATQIRNDTGRRNTNTTSGTDTLPSTVVPTTPSDEPGYP